MTSNEQLRVQAIYSFTGKNNDELCLKKGDIVIVSQKENGGWWEGTLKDKTGWFPSNYVKEYKCQEENTSNTLVDLTEQLRANRAVIVMDIIESERAHVTELHTLIQSFLIPLKNSNIMVIDEYNQLVNNIEEVFKVHKELLESLEQISTLPQSDQKLGKLFLNKASHIRSVHLQYCSSHPRAVTIIEKYKDELNQIMESHGAVSPGILVLTVSLSKPFRRLDKYSGILQELTRHLEDNHVDRGNTQRSISVYKDISAVCLSTRKQKELELSILNGNLIGWEGPDLSSFGESIKIGSVAFFPEHKDRYLMLFSTHLVILSVSQRISSFIYEGKLPLSGICVKKLNDNNAVKNAFKISGSLIDSIIAVCQSKEDQTDWVQKINKQLDNCCIVSTSSGKPVSSERISPSFCRLGDYFAHLVCKGVITRTLLKLILYTQYLNNNIDTSKVVRRCANKSCQSFSPCTIKQYCSQGTQYENQSNEPNSYNVTSPRHCSSMVLREDGKIVYGKKLLFTPTKGCLDLTKSTLYKEDNMINDNQHFLIYESNNDNLKSKYSTTIPLFNVNNKDENIYLSDNRDSTFSMCDLKTPHYNNFCENEKNTGVLQDFQYFKCKDHNSLRSSDSGLADIAIQVTQPLLPAEMSIRSESLHNINSCIFEDDSLLLNTPIPFEKGVKFRTELYAHWWFKTKLPGICDSGKISIYL